MTKPSIRIPFVEAKAGLPLPKGSVWQVLLDGGVFGHFKGRFDDSPLARAARRRGGAAEPLGDHRLMMCRPIASP